MIWLTCRQFRAHAVVAAAALAMIAGYLVILGRQIREAHDGYLAQCQSPSTCAELMTQFQIEYSNLLLYLAGAFMLAPFMVGLFWGAPLVARELESGTHRMVWNQSVTRRRWLTTKLLLLGLAAMAAAGLISFLLTWAASPVDQVAGDRFTAVVFGARNIAPVAHAAFAFVLGTVIGMVVRRTLPAMALTLLVLAVVQIGMPNLVRPHLMQPVTETVPMTAEVIREDTRGLGSLTNRPTVKGLTIAHAPSAWVVSTTELRTSDGKSLDIDLFNDCIFNPGSDAAECLGDLDLHVQASYHPKDRYWPFQWLESATYLAFSVLLAGFAMWRLQRHLS